LAAEQEEDVEELTLAKVTTTIRHHQTFKLLTKEKQREYSAQHIKDFILKNKFFKKYIKEDLHTKQTYLIGWKFIVEEE
jgi:hypothetical protein